MSRMSQARRAILRVGRDPSITRVEALEKLAKLKIIVEDEEAVIEADLRTEAAELEDKAVAATGGVLAISPEILREVMPLCEICGQPLRPGEEMFRYHGFSGPCPSPPQQKLVTGQE